MVSKIKFIEDISLKQIIKTEDSNSKNLSFVGAVKLPSMLIEGRVPKHKTPDEPCCGKVCIILNNKSKESYKNLTDIYENAERLQTDGVSKKLLKEIKEINEKLSSIERLRIKLYSNCECFE